MKELKEFIQSYMGCECITDSEIKGNLITLNKEAGIAVLRIGEGMGQTVSKYITEIKPILRPLSSMTEEERAEITTITDGKLDCPKWVLWALSKHFDLFGLIESNLAVASNK